jgi:hypothetical protein
MSSSGTRTSLVKQNWRDFDLQKGAGWIGMQLKPHLQGSLITTLWAEMITSIRYITVVAIGKATTRNGDFVSVRLGHVQGSGFRPTSATVTSQPLPLDQCFVLEDGRC